MLTDEAVQPNSGLAEARRAPLDGLLVELADRDYAVDAGQHRKGTDNAASRQRERYAGLARGRRQSMDGSPAEDDDARAEKADGRDDLGGNTERGDEDQLSGGDFCRLAKSVFLRPIVECSR